MAAQAIWPKTWSELPTDLLHEISSRMDYVNLLRVRAICSSWRRRSPLSRPPFRLITLPPLDTYTQDSKSSPSPPPFRRENIEKCASPENLRKEIGGYFHLRESIVYLIQPYQTDSDVDSWLVKVRIVEGHNIFRLLSPLSARVIKNVKKSINLLEFSFIEIKKVYHITDYVKTSYNFCIDAYSPNVFHFKKVLYLEDVTNNDFRVLVLDIHNCLYFFDRGCECWTLFKRGVADVILYNEFVIAIGCSGSTYRFDKYLKREHLVKKNLDYKEDDDGINWEDENRIRTSLVEDHGGLALVQVRNYRDNCDFDYSRRGNFSVSPSVETFTLDFVKEEWTRKELDSRVVFLGEDCSFVVSRSYVQWYKVNTVYHVDKYVAEFDYVSEYGYDISDDEDENTEVALPSALQAEHVFVSEYRTCRHLDEYPDRAKLVWPPPLWLNENKNGTQFFRVP